MEQWTKSPPSGSCFLFLRLKQQRTSLCLRSSSTHLNLASKPKSLIWCCGDDVFVFGKVNVSLYGGVYCGDDVFVFGKVNVSLYGGVEVSLHHS
jgi:CRISPR/Cas system-associated protein Cas10 (large subunit of type III CRISPR-Cas system)